MKPMSPERRERINRIRLVKRDLVNMLEAVDVSDC